MEQDENKQNYVKSRSVAKSDGEETCTGAASGSDLKKSLRRSAMDLLARREHSAHELGQKLSRRYSCPELIETVIAQLGDDGLQSDSRFAESFIRYRSQRGQGPARLRQELLARGVDDTFINTALAECQIDWYQLAERTYLKKFSEAPATEQKERAKRIRFMLYRGFDRDHFEALL